jgi:HAMP domain-containing protein
MVYRFEDLRVWQAGKTQSDRIGELRKRREFLEDGDLRKYLTDSEAEELIEASNAIGRMIRRLQATLRV